MKYIYKPIKNEFLEPTIIDSIHTESSIIEFLKKILNEMPKFGKVIYKYDKNEQF